MFRSKISLFVLLILFSTYVFRMATYSSPLQTKDVQVATVVAAPQIPEKVVAKVKTSSTVFSVVRVIDGDTIVVEVGDTEEKVRLIGVDTPETVDPRKKVQCFGKEASSKMKEILTGQNVELISDQTQDDRDKYGRLLRYVYLEDGTFVNKLLIQEGFAHEYTYRLPYKFQKEFKEAEVFARTNSLGLWSASACN